MTDDREGNLMRRATITGWGKYAPPAVLTNADLETVMDTSDEWITSRSGIKERRISHVGTSDMAAAAGREALAAAGLAPEDIDLVVVATCTPDRTVPSVASFVQKKMALVNAGSLDINAACSGFVYGLAVVNGMVATGAAHRVLLIGAERLSAHLDLEDRATAVLFGDGAGAVVLEGTEGTDGVLAVNTHADGTLTEILAITGTGTERAFDPTVTEAILMEGREVFRHAVTRMGEAAIEAITAAGMGVEDVDLLITHQANIRIIDATARRLELAPEQVYVNIASYGNTSAASIPIALAEALEQGVVDPGDVVVFAAFGGGLTWGAAAVRWGERVTPLGTADHEIPGTDATALELLAARVRNGRR
jgi:3-oxoacyl-[acyl-carrier-protein] synthase-3